MACYKPLLAHRLGDGSISFSSVSGAGDAVSLPCGQCIGCRIDRSRMWAARCMHEAQLYDENCFITLTYSEEFLPSPPSLDYSHFQLFMKRLRKHFYQRQIRFYMCGEYGSINWRPHFHAILFNLSFPDRLLWQRTGAGNLIYRSRILEKLWPFGHSSIGECTFESAGYVARYCMKKVTGERSDEHYRRVSPETGELYSLRPEFAHMSMRPGIGAKWLERYRADVYPSGKLLLESGKVMKVPRYYDKLYSRVDCLSSDELKQERVFEVSKSAFDNVQDRLDVKEEVLQSRLNRLHRSLE